MAASKDRSVRTVNIEPEVWAQAKDKAKAEGQSLSAVIRQMLEVYVEEEPRQDPDYNI